MRYLVMRRTMTGTWEDCGEVEVEPMGLGQSHNMKEAQRLVGDGPGCYRVVDKSDSAVGYVNVQVTRERIEAPPPVDTADDVPWSQPAGAA